MMSRVFFLLVIAVLPVQLSKFFFLDHSFVLGIPIDYRAAALYLSDIAIVMFTIAAILENRKRIVVIAARYKDYIAALAVFNLYLFFSAVFFSVSPPASYFFSLKFFIFSLFSIAAAVALQNRRVGQNGLLVLGISVFWQALLLIAQFARQGAIGLQILGERSFDAGTVQIAHSQLAGRQFLRPYGTFPHPNVAAAYLAFSLIILFGAAGAQKRKLAPARIILAITTILAVFLTFSKSAIAVLLLGVLATVKSLPRLLLLLLPVAIIGFFAASQLWANLAPVAERLLLSQAALDIALINPAFGVGAANFILELARLDLVSLSETRLLQPVHNVFLLILAENGIFGLMIFAALLLVVARYLQGRTKTVIFIGLLLYLSLDHFLWTLQQGQMMFFLTLAYIVSQSKK